MRYETITVLTSLRRARAFLDEHGDLLDAVERSTGKQLDAVVSTLSDLSVSQETGIRCAKGETARQRALLLALRRHYMTPVAELAKLELRSVPEFPSLTMPPRDVSTRRLVTTAYSMADAATPFTATFIDGGLPATFADDIRSAAAAVEEATGDRGSFQDRRSGATAGLIAAERRGRALLKILNALISARIGNDAELVGEWKAAKRVARKPGPASRRGQAVDATPIHPAADASASTAPALPFANAA